MRVIIFLFLAILAYSKTLTATYEAKYGWFGTIATAKGIYEKNETDYKIYTQAKFVGIAAALSKHLIQSYISIGKIKNNILIPQKYIRIRKNSSKIEKTVITFDHKNKRLIKTFYKNNHLEYNRTLNYYTKYDILSAYFNLPYLLKRQHTTIYALGGRRKDGKIDVFILDKNSKTIKIKAILYNKIFASSKGELYLDINNSNWVTLKGVVKNVLKIGDLKGKLVNFKQVP